MLVCVTLLASDVYKTTFNKLVLLSCSFQYDSTAKPEFHSHITLKSIQDLLVYSDIAVVERTTTVIIQFCANFKDQTEIMIFLQFFTIWTDCIIIIFFISILISYEKKRNMKLNIIEMCAITISYYVLTLCYLNPFEGW